MVLNKLKEKCINIFFFCSLILLFSCTKNIEYSYYENGTVYMTIESTEIDSIKYITDYYRNGNIKSEGLSIYSGDKKGFYPHGQQIEYYSDGEIKWIGEYIKGQMVVGTDEAIDLWKTKPSIIQTPTIPNQFILNDSIKFRVIVEDVHPDFYAVTLVDKVNSKFSPLEISNNEEEAYPYTMVITPNIIQTDTIGEQYVEVAIFFYDKNGVLKIPSDNNQGFKLKVNGD